MWMPYAVYSAGRLQLVCPPLGTDATLEIDVFLNEVVTIVKHFVGCVRR